MLLTSHAGCVTADPDGRDQLPIACTLGPADGAHRVEDWRRVTTLAGSGRKLAAGRIILKFRDLPEVSTELERLVAAERDCCGFLSWDLVHADAEWMVEITGDDDDLRALLLAE
jgi:hypothetical protein